MLYYILRPIVRVILKVYFRKVHIIGLEKLPTDRPLLIASNHPTGFLEPCIMACFFPISLHFLTRGDLFKKPLLNFIFKSTHQIPIFRFKDGFNAMRKNKGQFEATKNALKDGKSIVVYIEGSTSTSRKLRKFQKGLAKMLKSSVEEDPSTNVGVLPVAVNFSNANSFRSSVSVEVFDIIEPSDYKLDSSETNSEIIRLTEDIYEKMKPGVFHIDDTITDEQFNSQLNLFMYEKFPNFFPHVDTSEELKNRGKKMESQKWQSSKEIKSPFSFWSVNDSSTRKFAYILLMPFALIGYLTNYPPNKLSKLLTYKKVKLEAFIAPILIASNLCFYLTYLVIVLLLGFCVNNWILSLIIIVPLFGYIYLYHLHLKEKIQLKDKWDKLDSNLKEEVNQFKIQLK